MNKNLTALIILDGYGFTRCTEGSAFYSLEVFARFSRKSTI